MDIEQAQQYVTSGNEATRLKLVRDVKDINDETGYFNPDMCHQVFGENETIFGYKNLKINVLFDANSFHCYVSSSYDSKIESEIEAEDFMEKINSWLPSNYTTDKNEFLKCIDSENKLHPFGKKLQSFRLYSDSKKGREYEIYTCNTKENDYADFHQRMETLIVWYIDAANFIDTDDEKWQFFILYEKDISRSPVVYYPVGYSSVYEYFAYPDSRRYRISQFIIFPPHQNLGLGTELLKAIYDHLGAYENIFDITVEDPSEKFQLIRDYLDMKSCLILPSFSPQLIKGDFSKNMIAEARSQCKINEKQCRRVYEILRLYYTNVENANDYNAYKIMVKNRLNAPFRRQQQSKKLSKLFKDQSYLQYDHRLKIIEKDFQNLMSQYRHVIARVGHHRTSITQTSISRNESSGNSVWGANYMQFYTTSCPYLL